MTFVVRIPWILREHCGLGSGGPEKESRRGQALWRRESWRSDIQLHGIDCTRLLGPFLGSLIVSSLCQCGSVRFLRPWWRRQFLIGGQGVLFRFIALEVLGGVGLLVGSVRAAFFGWSLVLDWSFRLSDGLGLRTIWGSLKVTGVRLYSGSHSTGRFLRVVSRNEKTAEVSLGSSRSNL